jgi:2-haloalkanoic acid dehalogenase type II
MKQSFLQVILLDFYGTVVEEIHLPVKAICDAVCQACGGKVRDSEFIQYWVQIFSRLSNESHGPHFKLQKEIERESLQAAIDHFGVALPADQLAGKLADYRAHPRLFPESQAVLASIKLPVCLLTNIDNQEIDTALEYTGLHFAAVVTSEDCQAYKPRAEVFQKALDRMHCRPGEALHVGDSYHGDVIGALDMGIKVLWIDRRARPLPAGSRQADFMARDLTGLSDVIRSQG